MLSFFSKYCYFVDQRLGREKKRENFSISSHLTDSLRRGQKEWMSLVCVVHIILLYVVTTRSHSFCN